MAVDYLSAINQGGSGLNVTQIVDSLVEAEQAPQETQIQSKIDARNTAISAIGEIKSALSKLSTALTNLTGNTSLKVNSTSSAISASITDPSTAVAINSSISISSLAKGQTLAFEDYSSTTSIVGAGTLLLERGDWSSGSFVASSSVASEILTVTETDTLESLKDKINALNYGAPPHGGIAPGLDRIVMLLANEKNIREVTMFPMNQNAQDLMMNAPSEVSEDQLKELGISVKLKK